MEIATLPLPNTLIESCLSKGIRELYPPQAACVDAGLLDGKNLLISIPTASGKTLLAEMAMASQIARGGKCLYIVPLRALASEKFEEFKAHGSRVGVATGDFDRIDNQLGSNDIIVATSEKVDSLLRNRTRWLSGVTLMVLDEVHLIGSEHRGATLEMVITKMRYANPQMQIIGLSATIGNPKALASWLEATLISSTWRPVDLRQGVYFDGTIQFGGKTEPRTVRAVTKHDDLNLCLDTIEEGGQCLVFVSSRRNAEAFAKRAASAIKAGTPDSKELAIRIRQLRDADQPNLLAECVERGAAFHHAGLKREERLIIEEGFRKGYLEIISATPTLAAGLNLPARRVIIRDYMRFTSGLGMVPIPVMEYHQMAGRAGRPHLDPYGESVLIAKDRQTVEKLIEFFIDAGAEEINSQCADENALCAHILSLIATGFARDTAALTDFMERTFYAFQHPHSRSMGRIVGEATRFLVSAAMITDEEGQLSATKLGYLISVLYLDPHGARNILDILQKSDQVTDIGILHLICTSPDMPRLYLKSADTTSLKSFLYKNGDDLMVPLPYDSEKEEIWLAALKTALVLADWAEEVSEEKMEDRYGIGAGDIYNVVDSAKWLLHAADRLVGMEIPAFKKEISQIGTRVQYGVKEELLPLVQLRNIGRVRARRLYNAGYTNRDRLREAGLPVLTRILGQHLARQILTSVGASVPDLQISGKKETSSSGIASGEVQDLTDLPTIGTRLVAKLRENGINSVSDLLNADHEILATIIGSKRAEKVLLYLSKQYLIPSENDELNESIQMQERKEKSEIKRVGQQSFSDFL
ncbi:MAG TPA: ATP-dependent DNA helicase [Methanospirillum sp.]|uniref:ATP-dependent DNA helicase n=1 Tax=Methanospirillum sp. TaxID=45200 RepID=UPI002B6FC4FC|nr:ATP-dependent DNA helicase [Methanospirillum sp.]HWQ62836.1 ATP-dependent DNA helicase [Methanospirillum sp.]